MCEAMAENGACSGLYVELERQMRTHLNETSIIERLGFSFNHYEEPQPTQVDEMMKFCRKTCKEKFKDVPFDELPELVRGFGGYEDIATDNFGRPLPLCSIKDGFVPAAVERALGILGIGHFQKKIVPPLHPVGFEKRKIPKDIYARILNQRKRLLNNGVKWSVESCDLGMQNCVKAVESSESKECHLVSAENYHYMDLGREVKAEVFNKLRDMAQAWIGDFVEISGTSLYGIRKYSRGAFLLGHLDHLR